MPYVVVGLGNPTDEYARTRHNVGRMVVSQIAQASDAAPWKLDKSVKALRAKGEIAGEKAEFLLPETYMNRSGGAVAALVRSVKAAERLIVVYDDLDLPLGSIKVSFDRGSGGHNGVESIIRALKTRAFVRVRIGIAPVTAGGTPKKPRGEQAVLDFLMGNLSKKEETALSEIARRAGEIIGTVVAEGREKAMNSANQQY